MASKPWLTPWTLPRGAYHGAYMPPQRILACHSLPLGATERFTSGLRDRAAREGEPDDPVHLHPCPYPYPYPYPYDSHLSPSH